MNLLYNKSGIKITDKISISIPTLGEVIDNEDNYYDLVSLIVASPSDLMVMLDSAGIDFTTITDYELFLLMFSQIQGMDTKLVFGSLDISGLQITMNEQNDMPILRDDEQGIIIDRLVYEQIAAAVRKINHLKKNNKKPGNEEAKEYLLEKAKKKARRNKNKPSVSYLEPLIVSLVNTEQFKYNFDTVRDLTIYQFNESLKQIIKKIDYNNKMRGVYAGTIDTKNLSPDDFNWLTHK